MTVPLPIWSDPKPDLEPCVCGCEKIGRPRRRAWNDGLGPHVKACGCRRCEGGRHKGRAGIRERRIAKDTGGQRSELSGALSGYDGRAGLDVWEETTNKAITRGFFRWFNGKGVQAKVERLYGLGGVRRHLILEDSESKQRMVVTPYEDWCQLVEDAAGF